jgi:CBS domain-containing protein
MKHRCVENVMTTDVVSVHDSATFKEVTELLTQHRISGLPVVDADRKVVGVISETDLMARQATEPGEPGGRHGWHLSRAARDQDAKASARTARELMSTPPVTVPAGDSIAGAARTMARHSVERLPVVDAEGRLVGIVARRDVLQVFLRSDEDIRADVLEDVLVHTLWLAPGAINVAVHEGVVTLKGQLERHSQVPVALRMTAQVDGVVAVDDQLTYALDDSHLHLSEQDQERIRKL